LIGFVRRSTEGLDGRDQAERERVEIAGVSFSFGVGESKETLGSAFST